MKSLLNHRTIISLTFRLFARQRTSFKDYGVHKLDNDQSAEFGEMLNLCEDYQSLLALKSDSASNNLKIVKKLAENESIKSIPFTTYHSRSQFNQILNSFKNPSLFDPKTQVQIFLLCKKFRIDRNKFLEELCSQLLQQQKTLSLVPADSYFQFISALSFYGVSDFTIQNQLIEQAFSKLSQPEEFYELFMFIRERSSSEQETALYESFQRVIAHGSSFKPQSLINMLEIEVTKKNQILLAKLIQEIKRNAKKLSASQILQVTQNLQDLNTLGLSFSQVLFEKDRIGSTKYFKNASICIDLMEQFHLKNLLTKNLGELLEKHILSEDMSSLDSDYLVKFFIIHCLWFEFIKNQDDIPMTPRQAKQILKRHDSLVELLLQHVLARNEQIRATTLLQLVQIYLYKAETHRRSIKRYLFSILKLIAERKEELQLIENNKDFTGRFRVVLKHCALNNAMKQEFQQVMKSIE